MSLPELSCVCIPGFGFVAPIFFLDKVQFGSFYRKGCGHIDIIEMVPSDTDSKYMGLWSNSKRKSRIHGQTDNPHFILPVGLLQHGIGAAK